MNVEELKALMREPDMKERILRFSSDINDGSIQTILEKMHTIHSKDPNKEIILHLCTGGGSWAQSVSFYETIKMSQIKLITIASGRCMSGGMVMLMSSEKEYRFGGSGTIFLTHPAKNQYKDVRMGIADLSIELSNLQMIEDIGKRIYLKETDLHEESFLQHYSDEKFMDAKTAKECGFIHEIIEF